MSHDMAEWARRLLPFGCALLLAGCATYEPKPIAPATMATVFESRPLADTRLQTFLQAEEGTPANSSGWNLHTLTLAALYFHPDLDVAYARLATARAGIVTAAELPNPMLDLAGQYNTTQLSPSPIVAGIAINVLIETFGKRDARTDQAKALAEAARADVATATWQVRGRVRNALLDLWMARRRLELGRRRLEVQEQVLGLLEQRQTFGEASRVEVAREQISRDQLILALEDVTRAEAAARAALATAIGVPLRALDGVTMDFSAFDAPPKLDADTAHGSGRRRALVERADLKASLAHYDAAEAALRLEVARQYPNVTLGPGFEYDQGGQKIGIPAASLDLPIFNQNQGPIGEAIARRREAAANFNALQDGAIGAIDAANLAYITASQALAKANALVSSAEKQQSRAAVLFRAGQTDRLTLALGELEVAAIRLSSFDVAVAQRQALGQLEDALQQPVFDPGRPVPPSAIPPRSQEETANEH
ncbi:MAG: outer membrane protein [Rhodospirillales bacterium]|nr:outer membrane protein [Rhodospirillales bacterium]